MPEVEVGRVVVAWLQHDYWDVWQEVGTSTGSGVCDIVARRGPVVHAIECKTRANLDVLEQASYWVHRAHLVSVAVPRPRKERLYARLAASLGLGVIWVGDVWRDRGVRGLDVVAVDQGPMSRVLERRWSRPLSDLLTPERQSWPAEAGNNLGHRYTPFRESCDLLLRVVTAEPGITMRAAVEKMGAHHYHTDKAARSALSQWVRMGKVRGVWADTAKRPLQLWPEEQCARPSLPL